MGMRIFSVVGEALHFGGRRMETTARIAWLPLSLMMLANMAAIFSYLSVIAGRLVTFSDLPSFMSAQQAVMQLAATGFAKSPGQMWTISAINLSVNWILVSTYMAPLIRFAGRVERPAPGAVRLAFGADQLRFIASSLVSLLFVAFLVFGPVAGAAYYVMKYIADALSQTVAIFPDPESLHTIVVSTAGEQLGDQGAAWVYNHAIPLAGAAPLIAFLWGLILFHFRPSHRPAMTGSGNFVLRALASFAATVFLLAVGYVFFAEGVMKTFVSNTVLLGSFADIAAQLKLSPDGLKQGLRFLVESPARRLLLFGVTAFFLVSYFSLRLFPYPGVAVCRGSMAPAHAVRLSRGWGIVRLQVIVFFVGALTFIMQAYVINLLLLKLFLPWVTNVLYAATAVSTKLVNSGAVADWVLPLFIWVWNIVKIIVNFVWTFFTIGVAAGLYGRLYRESETAQ